ncbi:phage/plasmid primase, P4 family [Celeribacter sp. PS-C1]|uniref:DNA primase family protein n=1 Tax=Celeribacter sp. PS-C1 TaxID=2820813 RepID=UPI001CA4B3EF|nr:phage/plasmid primase, P4 family [Celeribacter sp. PS-C1]MBW6419343.1 hypothetical protein [Celeribacter sp. PS-C1]
MKTRDYIADILREIDSWELTATQIRETAERAAVCALRNARGSDDFSTVKHLLPVGAEFTYFEDALNSEDVSEEAKRTISDHMKSAGIEPINSAYVADPILRTLSGRDIFFSLCLDDSDVDMAKRLLAVWHDRLGYSKALGGLEWNGTRWLIEEEDTAALLRAAQEIAERMAKEPRVAKIVADSGLVEGLTFTTSKKDADQVRKDMPEAWVMSHQELTSRIKSAKSARAMSASVEVAKKYITIKPSELDTYKHLLTTPEGTINLRTGKLEANNPENLITRMSPVKIANRRRKIEFDPSKAPVWMKALNEAFLGDQDLIDYMQRFVGYTLTGETTEQKFWFFYGTSSNMKGRFCEVMRKLVPEQYSELDVKFMMKQHGNTKQLGGTNEEIANLRGARLIHAEESSADDVLDEAPMKKISGGGRLEASMKFKSSVAFQPEGKIVLETNHRPRVLSQDNAIWRRIVEIPFLAHFADPGDAGYIEGFSKPKDPLLDEKLENELPQILAWAVEGAVQYYEQKGLGAEPKAIVEAREHYKTETDVLADFLACCTLKSEGKRVRAGDVYAAYKNFMEKNSLGRVISSLAFSAAMTERGFGHERKGGVIYRTGISLNVAGTCYQRGVFPGSEMFNYRIGDRVGLEASCVDDLPKEIRAIVAGSTMGQIPSVGTSVDTPLGKFVRTA